MVPWRQPRVRVCMSVLPLASLCGCCSCAADAFQPWMWKQLCVVLNCACKPCGNQGEASGWCPRAATHACMQPLMCVCDGVRPWCTPLLLLCNAAVAVAGAVATMGCCCCHCLLLPPLLLPPLLQQHHHAPHHHHKQQPHHQSHHHQKQQHPGLAITNPTTIRSSSTITSPTTTTRGRRFGLRSGAAPLARCGREVWAG